VMATSIGNRFTSSTCLHKAGST